MKYFYDSEFYEDGERIHLISFGIVAEDGRELYLENIEFDWEIVPDGHWIWDNVYPHLVNDTINHCSRKQIAEEVRKFICDSPTYWSDNKLYGYYVAYDHVVLAQLFGRMVDMPREIPWFSFDLKQMVASDHRLGTLPDTVKQDGTRHHALEDARWNKKLYEAIIDYRQGVY